MGGPEHVRMWACSLALIFASAAAQQGSDGAESTVVLEVQAVRDSLSFTRTWWGDTDPHHWISTEGDPHDVLRFEGLEVPQGARIDSAIVTVWSYNAATDDPDDYVTLWMEQVDDAERIAGPADAWGRKNNGGRRIRWPTTNPGRGRPQPSPDVRDLLQEIVDRPGWESGNAVQFFASATRDPAHDGRQMHSYWTGLPGRTRATLEVRFTPESSAVDVEFDTPAF